MGFFSKLLKPIKKVFKKIVKVVKKILKSKLFKVLAIAALVWFGGAALVGMLNAGAAATGAAAAGASATAGGAAAAAGSAATVGAAGAAGAAGGTAAAAATTSTGLLGSIGTGVKAVGSFAAAHPIITSAALSTGGTIVAGIARSNAEKEQMDDYEKEMEYNASTQLNIGERLKKYAGSREAFINKGITRHMAGREKENMAPKPFYNQATDTYGVA